MSFPVTLKCLKAAAARRGLRRRPMLHAPVSTQLPGEVPQHRTLVLLLSGAVMIASEIANIAINVSSTSPQPDLREIAISTGDSRTCCRAADRAAVIHWLVSQHARLLIDTTSSTLRVSAPFARLLISSYIMHQLLVCCQRRQAALLSKETRKRAHLKRRISWNGVGVCA